VAWEILDSLPGGCPECHGMVIIDGEGLDRPHYWAFCDGCLRTCCVAESPAGVAERWERERAQGTPPE
jgi:hypothetical protein